MNVIKLVDQAIFAQIYLHSGVVQPLNKVHSSQRQVDKQYQVQKLEKMETSVHGKEPELRAIRRIIVQKKTPQKSGSTLELKLQTYLFSSLLCLCLLGQWPFGPPTRGFEKLKLPMIIIIITHFYNGDLRIFSCSSQIIASNSECLIAALSLYLLQVLNLTWPKKNIQTSTEFLSGQELSIKINLFRWPNSVLEID